MPLQGWACVGQRALGGILCLCWLILIFGRYIFRPEYAYVEYGSGDPRKHLAMQFYLFFSQRRVERDTWPGTLRRKHAWLAPFLQPVRKGLGRSLWFEAISLGEMNSSSAKQAGKQPRADKENPPSPSCYRETLKGLRMAGFLVALCSQRTGRFLLTTPGAPPLIGEGWAQPQCTRWCAADPQRVQAVFVCEQYNITPLHLGSLHPMTMAHHPG